MGGFYIEIEKGGVCEEGGGVGRTGSGGCLLRGGGKMLCFWAAIPTSLEFKWSRAFNVFPRQKPVQGRTGVWKCPWRFPPDPSASTFG